MEVVRILKLIHYDVHLGRFQSCAFQPSSRGFGGGISVIGEQCIAESGATICEHIRRYYADLSEEPPLFWRFSTDALPLDCRIVPQVGDNGDDCHYSIAGLSKKDAGALFRASTAHLEDVYICGVSCARPATAEALMDSRRE